MIIYGDGQCGAGQRAEFIFCAGMGIRFLLIDGVNGDDEITIEIDGKDHIRSTVDDIRWLMKGYDLPQAELGKCVVPVHQKKTQRVRCFIYSEEFKDVKCSLGYAEFSRVPVTVLR
ncbi:hypothetical protein [uncultured Amphritea sp.]|uniref:hypothetical protein n=1 Tax=uncultured Amphritea sp. TaxID=981605 RepID=UPI00260EFE6A|nr:hypothetical protein [uncultured Amphritea sp.]